MLIINKEKGINIEVFDIETKKTIIYSSIREAAKAINCVKNTLHYNEKQQLKTGQIKPIKERYLIKIIRE